jgi:ABC-2 type transport system ATP-binding protein
VLQARAAQGAAILFSSHQLDVVERLCDDLVIIAGGTIRASGSREQLRAQHSAPRYELVSDADAGWIRSEPGITVVDFERGTAVFDAATPEDAQRVLRTAFGHGAVHSFAPQHPSLAQIFKEVIQ